MTAQDRGVVYIRLYSPANLLSKALVQWTLSYISLLEPAHRVYLYIKQSLESAQSTCAMMGHCQSQRNDIMC